MHPKASAVSSLVDWIFRGITGAFKTGGSSTCFMKSKYLALNRTINASAIVAQEGCFPGIIRISLIGLSSSLR